LPCSEGQIHPFIRYSPVGRAVPQEGDCETNRAAQYEWVHPPPAARQAGLLV
jgi:hypothetical protein